MQPFVVNRHGRLVFPSNFIPELDFSVIDTEQQLVDVIRRDFEKKAPTGTDILEQDPGRLVPEPLRPDERHGAEFVLGQPLRCDHV